MTMDLHACIKRFNPESKFSLNNNDYAQLTWFSKDIIKPTLKELEDTWVLLLTEREANKYIEERAKAYPPLGEQLDAIWKELNYRRLQGEKLTQEADDVLGKVLAVKAKYPKPEGIE